MSQRAVRPEPLARLVRRSDRRCVLAAGWFVFVGVLHVATLRAEDRVFEGAIVAPAVVDEGYRPGSGDLTVPVVIGERAVETREVRDAPLPAPGDIVEVEVAAGQPGVVRLTGSSYSPITDAALQVGPLAVCGLLAVGRRRFAASALRRARGDEPTFAVVGVVRAGPFSRRRCVLDLYALDARPEAAPLVSVPLASVGEVPLGVPVTAGVKGVPRPYSLVVAKVGDAVLWPSAPAIGARRRPSRPAGLVEPSPLPGSPSPGRIALPSLLRRPPVLAAGAALLFLAATAAVVSAGAARDQERVDGWNRVEATVLGPGEADCTVRVRYRVAGRAQEAAVTTGDCGPVATGPGHLVLVDPADPTRASLLASRYDPWSPLSWAALVTFAAVWWAVGEVRHHRRLGALADGPWRSALVGGAHRPSALTAPGDGGAPRAYLSDPAGLAGVVAVAGDVSPGSTFLVVSTHIGDARPPALAREVHARARPPGGSVLGR